MSAYGADMIAGLETTGRGRPKSLDSRESGKSKSRTIENKSSAEPHRSVGSELDLRAPPLGPAFHMHFINPDPYLVSLPSLGKVT